MKINFQRRKRERFILENLAQSTFGGTEIAVRWGCRMGFSEAKWKVLFAFAVLLAVRQFNHHLLEDYANLFAPGLRVPIIQ